MLVFVIFIVGLLVSVVNSHQSNSACPSKDFQPIGNKCYHFSKDEQTWDDAFYNCQNINSTLAIINRTNQELLIRNYLNKQYRSLGRFERWIGGKFDWKQGRWVWAETAKLMKFHAFTKMNPHLKNKWQWNCVIVDPYRQNKWSAKFCLEKKHYICQTQRIGNPKDRNAKGNWLSVGEIRRRNNPSPLIKKKFPTRMSNKDYICPPNMILIVKKCYYFSTEKVTWNDAHYACQANNSKLAVIKSKLRDNILRGFLNHNFVEKHERWIGGMYDWQQKKWLWAITGEPIIYMNFARMAIDNKDLTWNCVTLDPKLNHRWNTQKRSELKHYICQTKAKTVLKFQNDIRRVRTNSTVLIEYTNSSLLKPNNGNNSNYSLNEIK